MSTVAVVIPTRDRLPLLQEAVASVFAQKLEDWELIVVDDDSRDGTAAWLQNLGDERVRVIALADRSERSRARNEGLAATDCDQVLFLDDDDCLLPHSLGYLLNGIMDSDVVAAVGGQVTFDERGHRNRYPHPRFRMTRNLTFDILGGWSATPGRWLLRTDVVRDLGGFDERLTYAEDADLWLRVSGSGRIRILPQRVLEKRIYPGQTLPDDLKKISEEFRLRFAASLSGTSRSTGTAAIGVRRQRLAAENAVSHGDFVRGLRHVAIAWRLSPRIALSPLVRPYFAKSLRRALVGVVFGKHVFYLVRRVRAKVRLIGKRMPGE